MPFIDQALIVRRQVIVGFSLTGLVLDGDVRADDNVQIACATDERCRLRDDQLGTVSSRDSGHLLDTSAHWRARNVVKVLTLCHVVVHADVEESIAFVPVVWSTVTPGVTVTVSITFLVTFIDSEAIGDTRSCALAAHVAVANVGVVRDVPDPTAHDRSKVAVLEIHVNLVVIARPGDSTRLRYILECINHGRRIGAAQIIPVGCEGVRSVRRRNRHWQGYVQPPS